MAASSNNSEQMDWGRLMKGDLDYLFNCLDVARYDQNSKSFLWKCDMPDAKFEIPKARDYITRENFQEACKWRINARFDSTQWEVFSMGIKTNDGGEKFWKKLFELAGAKDHNGEFRLEKKDFKTFFTTFGFLGNMKVGNKPDGKILIVDFPRKPDGTIIVEGEPGFHNKTGTLEGEAEKAESKPKWPDFYCWTLRDALLYGFLPEEIKGFRKPENRTLAETFSGPNRLYPNNPRPPAPVAPNPEAMKYFNKGYVKDSVPDFDDHLSASRLSVAAFKDCTKLDDKKITDVMVRVINNSEEQSLKNLIKIAKDDRVAVKDVEVNVDEWCTLHRVMSTQPEFQAK